MSNQDVKCHVQTCKYNDNNRTCTLHDIVVGSSGAQAHDKASTQCDSFQEN
ncbi:MAG: DUF1540 domain-containing protein [Clostridiales bacterium]|jgi:hypothetical protein|nr:DUF1540 domain-containing protein [Clostridiales bacterium]